MAGAEEEHAPAPTPDTQDTSALDLSGQAISAFPCLHDYHRTLLNLNISRTGLASLPSAIGDLRCLTSLDASFNQIEELPLELGQLQNLRYLNLMTNKLIILPDTIGKLTSLYRLGLKGNQLEALPESFGGLTSLVELFLTDNRLRAFPASISQCTSLVKFQASFNQLESLPGEMGTLPKLELLRVAVNSLTEVPREFSQLHSLAWLSLGGNPVCKAAGEAINSIQPLSLDALAMGEALGDGASGDVYAANLNGKHVAVKVFRADASPDGHSEDEIAVSCMLDHPCLIRVLGLLAEPQGLVVERVFGTPLAAKPNLESLLRCRWATNAEFSAQFVMNVAADVAAALQFLHSRHIAHGDVYAHNVLADAEGRSVLCDYGASFIYHPGTCPYEAQEVRAYGLMLADMVARLDGPSHMSDTGLLLKRVADECLSNPCTARPSFAALAAELSP